MKEIFKDVVGYEDYYSISNMGNLVSKRSGKKLKPFKHKDGLTYYYRTTLSGEGKKHNKSIHRLVAEAFIPNPENLPIVNHIDNDGTNNKVSNLEWCTYSHNSKHAQKQGRLFEAQSKGAKSQALQKRKAMEVTAQNMIGSLYGKWKPLEYLGYLPVGSVQKPFVYCECSCGYKARVEVLSLLHGRVTQCRKCTGQEKLKRTYKNILLKYSNKTYKNWYITGKTNYTEGLATQYLKLEAKCTTCGNIELLPYREFKKGIIKKCPYCKKAR